MKLNWPVILYLVFIAVVAVWCFGAKTIEPNDIYNLWIYSGERGHTAIIQFSPIITNKYKHQRVENAAVLDFSSLNALKLIGSLWLQKDHYGHSIFNYSEFSILAKRWEPPEEVVQPPVIEPNEPPVSEEPFSVNESTGIVHRLICRYANPLTNTVIPPLEFYVAHLTAGDLDRFRACLVCKPDFIPQGQ